MMRPILACLLLAGCSDTFMTTFDTNRTAPVTYATPQANATAAVVNQTEIGDICADIATTRGSTSAQAGIAALRQQATFSETELVLIANGDVANGMSEKSAICAMGGNSISITEVKTTTSPGHVNKVFTFGGGLGSRLYTDNGVVIALR